MMNRLSERRNRLMPGGVPRYIRCYDFGEGAGDRYTVCFTGKAGVERAEGYLPHYSYRAMSGNPFHPLGIGLWCSNEGQPCDTIKPGKPGWHWPPAIGGKCHLGVRIKFDDLPEKCRELVVSDYEEIWQISEKEG